MELEAVKRGVEEFWSQRAYGRGAPDCFSPWFLHVFYQLPETTAAKQSSDGGSDYGLDGYALLDDPARPSRLLLVQAKYSESVREVASGISGFTRLLPELTKMLEAEPTEISDENKILVNLRSDLNRLDPQIRDGLNLEFQVIHLCREDSLVLADKIQGARAELKNVIETLLPTHSARITPIGPRDMGPRQDVVTPPEQDTLTFDTASAPLSVPMGRMFLGLGKLAEIADLYQTRRSDLFAKNVRLFIRNRRKRERGPSGKLKEALISITCAPKSATPPELFAFSHNGITLVSRRAAPGEGAISVAEPYVLNGCQTIETAYLFRNDPTYRGRVDESKWRAIRVPLRIIETRDEELVRQVTINSNRQNAIRAVALHANDPVQLELQERFRQAGVFYERQEGAFAELEASSPEDLEEVFHNSKDYPVYIEDLGRSIAAASGEIRHAEHPQDLFESDAAYNRFFNPRRLRSVRLLVLLQNLHDTVPTVLKKDLGLSQREGGPSPSRLRYYAMCLLLRHLAKHESAGEITPYAHEVLIRDSDFREKVAYWLSTRVSGIARVLREDFLSLPSSDGDALKAAFGKSERHLRLHSGYDPFDAFSSLDSMEEP